MKNTVKVFSITMILLALASTAFAKEKDKLDKWLDKYETFVEKVEKAVEKEKTSQIDALKAEKDKMFKEKDKIQAEEGNFTFKQGLRYAELNSRYGVSIGALFSTKGIKKAAKSVDEALNDED